MKKHLVSVLLTVCLVLGIVPFGTRSVYAGATITERSQLSGRTYTDRQTLADKLDYVFDGNINVYHTAADYPYATIPSSKPDATMGSDAFSYVYGTRFAVDYGSTSRVVGFTCWAYARGVYCTLFTDTVYEGGNESGYCKHSETKNPSASKSSFENCDVRHEPGALIQMSGPKKDRDGKDIPHSMILLRYDDYGITVLEGNGVDGLIDVRVIAWGSLGTINYVVQPTEAYLNEKYPSCDHKNCTYSR